MVILLCAAFVLMSAPVLAIEGGDVHLRALQGDVLIKIGEGDWVPAAVNTPVQQGDRIWVPEDAKAELLHRTGSIVRLDSTTALEVLGIEKDACQFYISTGHAYLNALWSDESVLVIDTPSLSFRSSQASAFRVDVNDNGETEASVFNGQIRADFDEGQVTIRAGERFLVRNGGWSEVRRLRASDEWERWNVSRDNAFAEVQQGPSTAYLPKELRNYSTDLDQHGRWVNAPDYGWGWVPTSTADNWSPYRDGRWTWIGDDYVWISSEPWGYAPYHYGRWAYTAPIGWLWVPPRTGSVYWGPGYVGWTRTARHISWFPLGPGERYYGRKYYGPDSVNITKGATRTTAINNVASYKNALLSNGVTTLSREAFLSGRSLPKTTKGNPFVAGRSVTAAPNIRPVKATTMPAVKQIPSSKLPPAWVRDLDTHALQGRLVVTRNKGQGFETRSSDRLQSSRVGSQNAEVRRFTNHGSLVVEIARDDRQRVFSDRVTYRAERPTGSISRDHVWGEGSKPRYGQGTVSPQTEAAYRPTSQRQLPWRETASLPLMERAVAVSHRGGVSVSTAAAYGGYSAPPAMVHAGYHQGYVSAQSWRSSGRAGGSSGRSSSSRGGRGR